jgi:predicted GIY-YIG superfamily endonuclease
MKYVYLLQRVSHPKKRYTGISADFQERQQMQAVRQDFGQY